MQGKYGVAVCVSLGFLIGTTPAWAERASQGQAWHDRLTISGVVEVEASATNNADEEAPYSGDKGSDVSVATVEVSMEAAIHELVTAQVVLLYEDDGDTPLDVDTAAITLGNTDLYPAYVTAGSMALPFGNFTTQLVSDPLTLEMAETLETALQVGFQSQGFYGSLYLFNGDARADGKRDAATQWGGNFGYAMENARLTLDVGLSAINSMEDADNISDALPDVGAVDNHVSGLGVYGILGTQGITLIGEYIRANEDFAPDELNWKGAGARPAAWNAELGYTFDWVGRETTVAAAWQGTREALALGLPEDRYLAAISVTLFDQTSLSAEWAHDKDYSANDGATGDTANTGTVQLAVEF